MKKFVQRTLLLLGLGSLILFQEGKAQLVLYEDFNYTPPTYIGGNGKAGSTSNNWTTHSVTSGQTTTIDVVNGNLSYPGLFAPNGYKVSMFGNANQTSRDINRAITSTSTVLYFSVLLNLIDNSGITTTGDYFMHFGATAGNPVTSFGARLGAKSINAGANYRFIIQNTSGGSPNFTEFAQDLSFGTTYLVVVKYDRSTSPTTASLWVNPSSLGGSEPAGSVSNASGTGTFVAFASICLRNNATTPKVEIDEIRVGPAWADVTPPGAAPSISTSVGTLTGFQYAFGAGPSASQTYNLSGANLTGAPGNISVTGSTNYEVSTNNTTFSGSVNVPYTGPTLNATAIYVRLKAGLALGNYNSENIANSGGGATAVNVVCSGSVIKPEPTNHATTFAAATGTPSFSVINTTWTDATGATTPDGYLVKGATGGYGSIVDPVDGTPETDALLVKNVAQGMQAKAFTDLIDNTQYYFKIFSYTNSGGFINYKTDGTVPTATATTTLSPSVTYTWQGADGAPWNVAANWTPTRTTPAINDILIFNGGGTKTVTAVPTQTVAKIVISDNTTINLQSIAAVTLSIMGGTGADLDIPAGCALNLNAPNVIIIALLTTATASISGSMTFSSTVSTAHRLTAADASAITFNAGATFTAGTFFSGNAFGNVKANSVIFASGSTYIHQAGSNPFVNNPPNSIVVFQTGSLYKLISNSTPSFSGKIYANFEMDATGVTVTTSGGSAVAMDNLTITNGTLNVNMTGTPGHSIKGNITVATGGTLNFAPSAAGTVRLNGPAAQSISGDGIITTGTNSTLEILNANGVDLGASITMNGKLKLTSGLLDLGSKNLLLGTTSTIEGTPSAANMIIATGAGQLQKGFSAAGSFLYPVGDSTGVAEYSPVTLAFTSGTFAAGNFAGVNLVNAKFPDDPNTGSYLNRYWNVTQTGITGFSCNTSFQYLLADVVGTESQIYCLKVLPTPFVTYDLANTTLQLLTASGLTELGTFTGSQPLGPTVTTSATLIDLTHNSATGEGNVTSDGGSPITARGLCYATTHNPTIADPHTTETGTTGVFTSTITGLIPQTTYYFRAYATNMVGTSYGSEVSFTTLCEPLAPVIYFSADTLVVRMGESINFFDTSLYCPTFWKWSFVGGEPYESNLQNPTNIVYHYPGTYTVCLDASNQYGYSSSCKQAYITVLGPTNAKIVMTEIMYNPPEHGTDTLEFIEIINNDTVAWNLSEFYFDQGVTYVFPDTLLVPEAYLVVAKSAAAMRNAFGKSALQWTEGSLNNNGEPIVIKDYLGFVVDSVYYLSAPPWDTLANGQGPSLELCDPNSDNTLPENWRHALEFQLINADGDSIWASPLAGCSYPPVAGFFADDTAIVKNEFVIFTDASTGDATGWEWTFEGGTPGTWSGQTPAGIQYNTEGSFDVTLVVSNNSGHTTLVKTDYIEVGPTGISTPAAAAFAIYPNPSNGTFRVVLKQDNPVRIRIINPLSDVVVERQSETRVNQFSQTDLIPGVYLIQVMDVVTKQSFTQKLVIQR
ncbi:MAG: PKD domain-containing protein [bacterium]